MFKCDEYALWKYNKAEEKTTIGGEIVSALGLTETVQIDANIKVLKVSASHQHREVHCDQHFYESCDPKYI